MKDEKHIIVTYNDPFLKVRKFLVGLVLVLIVVYVIAMPFFIWWLLHDL